MAFCLETTVAERKQRWCDFLDMSQPPRHLLLINYEPDGIEIPLPHPDKEAARIDSAWDRYERQTKRLEWLDDDTLPSLHVHTGTEIFAEAFGCRVHRPDDTMPSAIPLIDDASAVAKLATPTLDAPPFPQIFRIADELRRRAGDGALMKMADIQSPMDIAALIWNKNSFYPAMCEAPEAVKELAAKVATLLTAFLDEWYGRYGHEFMAHYPDYYMPAGFTVSEDEVGVVNATMFREFFLPELTQLSERYGGIGMHCCADSEHQWAGFLEIPGLRLLNLVQPPDVTRSAYEFFAEHVAQMHSWQGEGDPWTWPASHPPGVRTVIQAGAKDREEAIELAAKLRLAGSPEAAVPAMA